MGTPSTTNNGLLFLLIEVLPLTLILAEAPTEPEEAVTWTPAAFEDKAVAMFISFEF